MEMKAMAGTEIVREILKKEGLTFRAFAEKMGYKWNSSVAGRLNTQRISAEKLVEYLSGLGYDLVVRKADGSDAEEWKVTG